MRQWIDKGAPETEAELAAGATLETELTEHEILPIFQIRCVACHGKRKQEGGLDLRTVAGRLKGGKSGPAIKPGDPDGGLLISTVFTLVLTPATIVDSRSSDSGCFG